MGFKALKDVITKTLLSGTEKVFINDNGVTKQTAITNFMITDPEHAGNKVTSLDSFSNDKQYPSAKCVYDELQKKQDKEPFVVKVDGNSEDGYTSNYTMSEIYEAYSAGQRVICQYYGTIECIPIYISQATAVFATTVLDDSVINVFIAITSGNIQVLETPLQSKLTAGHNIDIDEDGIISASFDGLDSLPTSISNAMDTDGFGWTETKDYIGIDVQWDGNTEGLERAGDYVKISDLDIPNDQIVGLKYDAAYSYNHEFLRTTEITQELFEEFIEFEQIINDDYAFVDYWFIVHKDGVVVDDCEFAHKGIYVADPKDVEAYISRIYKEATTEEVVHQIAQKYIPGGSGGSFVVNLTAVDEETFTSDTTFAEVKQALINGQFVMVKLSIEGLDYIFSGGSLMPHPLALGEGEVITWYASLGDLGGVGLYCIRNGDETMWQFGL